jgi:hypothetical protein
VFAWHAMEEHETWKESKDRLVLGHVLRGSALPVDWCTLGGAERCPLRHWFPVGCIDEAEYDCPRCVKLEEREYCIVCEGMCEGRHTRLDMFHRQMLTLTRDSGDILEDENDFANVVWGLVESKFFLCCADADLDKVQTFSSKLLTLWRGGKGKRPGKGEIWNIAKDSGVGSVFR